MWQTFTTLSLIPGRFLIRLLPKQIRSSLAARLMISGTLTSFILLLIAVFILSDIPRAFMTRNFEQRLNLHDTFLLQKIDDLYAEIRLASALQASEATSQIDSEDSPFHEYFSGWYWMFLYQDAGQAYALYSRSLLNSPLELPDQLERPYEAMGMSFGEAEGPRAQRLRILRHKFSCRPLEGETPAQCEIIVSGQLEGIEQALNSLREETLFVVAIISLLLAGAITWQVRFGLQPLRSISKAIFAIRKGHQDKLDTQVVDELSPLTTEINALITANNDLVKKAQNQAGNLAHALKTPLSGILSIAEGLDREEKSTLINLAESMKSTITFHLRRTRAQSLAARHKISTDVRETLASLERSLLRIHASKEITFEQRVPEGLNFIGEKEDLLEIFGIILDNAASWCRGHIRLSGTFIRDDLNRTMIQVIIDDDGKGLSDEDMQSLGKRGVRLDESQPGSGLGLSICYELVEAYGGTMRLKHADIGGLSVEIRLPGAYEVLGRDNSRRDE